MSEVFEGLVVRADRDVVAQQLRRGTPRFDVRSEVLGDGLTVSFRTAPRDQMLFSEEWDRVAASVSESLGPVLVIRFDSRESHRSAALYQAGRLRETYTGEDELFVPLDDEGMPVTGAPPINAADLDPDEEYETAVNAIELGLRDLGAGDWPRLLAVIARSA